MTVAGPMNMTTVCPDFLMTSGLWKSKGNEIKKDYITLFMCLNYYLVRIEILNNQSMEKHRYLKYTFQNVTVHTILDGVIFSGFG